MPHVDVSLIAQWSQSQAQAATQWEAPTINAAAAAILRANPQASRAMLVLSDGGRPFLLLQFGRTWTDSAGAPIGARILAEETTPPAESEDRAPRSAQRPAKAASRSTATARENGSHRAETSPAGEAEQSLLLPLKHTDAQNAEEQESRADTTFAPS